MKLSDDFSTILNLKEMNITELKAYYNYYGFNGRYEYFIYFIDKNTNRSYQYSYSGFDNKEKQENDYNKLLNYINSYN